MQHLELVKWLAFIAMVVDHVDLVMFNRSVPWMFEVGRFAAPAFAICFGIGLAFSRDAFAVADRLMWPSVLAQCTWLLVAPPSYPLSYGNVLVVFTCCALVLACGRKNLWGGIASGVFLLAVSPGLEGGPGLIVLVAAGYLTSRVNSWLPYLGGFAPWLAGALSPGLVAAALAPVLARLVPFTVPRVRGLLAWGYPLHLAAIGLIASIAHA